MTLTEYRARLAKINAKIDNIYDTGQEINVVGAWSVKNPTLTELENQRDRIRSKILRLSGYNVGRSRPCFGGPY